MFLWIKVKPNAKRTRVTKWLDDQTIEIAIHAPPKEGGANAELVNFLSETLKVPKSHITIVSGQMAKFKRIEIIGNPSLEKLKEDQPRLLSMDDTDKS